jgi:hypothetical protein
MGNPLRLNIDDQITVSIPKTVFRELQKAAEATGMDVNEVLQRSIKLGLLEYKLHGKGGRLLVQKDSKSAPVAIEG